MSFLRFLAVGRSFIGARNETGRYRMMPESQLPTFVGAEASSVGGYSGEASIASGGLLSRWFGGWRASRRAGSARARSGPNIRRGPKAKIAREVSMVQTELRLDEVRVVRNDLTEEDLMVVPVASESANVKGRRDPIDKSESRERAVDGAVAEGASMEEAASARAAKGTPAFGGSGVVWNRLTARLFVNGTGAVERR